jgi:hypothetical protein
MQGGSGSSKRLQRTARCQEQPWEVVEDRDRLWGLRGAVDGHGDPWEAVEGCDGLEGSAGASHRRATRCLRDICFFTTSVAFIVNLVESSGQFSTS